MATKFIINSETLSNTANAIREKTNIEELINPENFAEKILGIDLLTKEYMMYSDLLEYPTPLDENNYTNEEVAKVDALVEHFENLGGDDNGE